MLGLSHPALSTRDLALFSPLRKRLKSRSVVELAGLVKLFMERNVGLDYEDSVRAEVLDGGNRVLTVDAIS